MSKWKDSPGGPARELIHMKEIEKLKVGDLVRVTNDPTGWIGHGIVMDFRKQSKYEEALVHWFDQWSDENPRDWNKVSLLTVLSER